MREIKFGMDIAKKRVNLLAGKEIIVLVNRGRNKMQKIIGSIDKIHESIFTVKEKDGRISSFSYNDILTKHVMFLPLNK